MTLAGPLLALRWRTRMDAEPEDDERDLAYESGPFCEHWGEPGVCAEPCLCGHPCSDHNGNACDECDCQDWKEPEPCPAPA